MSHIYDELKAVEQAESAAAWRKRQIERHQAAAEKLHTLVSQLTIGHNVAVLDADILTTHDEKVCVVITMLGPHAAVTAATPSFEHPSDVELLKLALDLVTGAADDLGSESLKKLVSF